MSWAPKDHSKAFPIFLGILRNLDCSCAREWGVCPAAAGWDGPTELSQGDASQGSQGCSQLPAAAVGAFQGCGVRIGLVRLAASFVSNKNQHFESAVHSGEGGFFRAPRPGPGASAGAGARPGACRGEPRGTGCSPSACPASRQGKLRHRLPSLLAWWGNQRQVLTSIASLIP